MKSTTIMLVTAACFAAGCVTSPQQAPIQQAPVKAESQDQGQDIVLSRIDGMSSRPPWLKESEPFNIEGGTVTSLGSTAIPADHRVEAAYRIAENNAKQALASAIEQKMEFIFQNAEEGTAGDTTQARFIGAEASKLATSSIRNGKRYWEKVSVIQQGGNRIFQIKVYSTVTMPESDFKTAIIDAIRKRNGQAGISNGFAEKVDKQWDKFTAEPPSNQTQSN